MDTEAVEPEGSVPAVVLECPECGTEVHAEVGESAPLVCPCGEVVATRSLVEIYPGDETTVVETEVNLLR